MPSSLIFAGLAAAWLVVLVPTFAKRRQEVTRTADATLASRVLHRAAPVRSRADHDEEMTGMTEQGPPRDAGRPFRPGRGGFDPEAAALAARARYTFRQRVVVGLLVVGIGAVALALTVSSTAWWAAGGALGALVGYLAYLRRQVWIEEEVRRRRAARQGGVRRDTADEDAEDHVERDEDGGADGAEAVGAESPESRPAPAAPLPPRNPRAVPLDLDDEDPAFDELGQAFEPPYRRAVGE